MSFHCLAFASPGLLIRGAQGFWWVWGVGSSRPIHGLEYCRIRLNKKVVANGMLGACSPAASLAVDTEEIMIMTWPWRQDAAGWIGATLALTKEYCCQILRDRLFWVHKNLLMVTAKLAQNSADMSCWSSLNLPYTKPQRP